MITHLLSGPFEVGIELDIKIKPGPTVVRPAPDRQGGGLHWHAADSVKNHHNLTKSRLKLLLINTEFINGHFWYKTLRVQYRVS